MAFAGGQVQHRRGGIRHGRDRCLPTFDSDDSFAAYIAPPGVRVTGEARPIATIVVIQEVFGVNAGIRRKCDKLAEAGA